MSGNIIAMIYLIARRRVPRDRVVYANKKHLYNFATSIKITVYYLYKTYIGYY